MARFPWLAKRKKTDPELPFKPPLPVGETFSNGEFIHEPTKRELKVRREILEKCDENARRIGVERREFIASAMGMATTLSVLHAVGGCGNSSGGANGSGGNGGSAGGSGGTSGSAGGGGTGGNTIPPDAMCDEGLAIDTLGGDEFILDLQTHHIEDEEHWRQSHPMQPFNGDGIASALNFLGCGGPPIDCLGNDAYLREIFLNSQTTVAVLSGIPGDICDSGTSCDSPIDNNMLVFTRDEVNAIAGSQRVIQHCQVAPNDRWSLQEANMERIKTTAGNWGWKCYPPWGPESAGPGGGWRLDDPIIADPFIQKVIDLTPSARDGESADGYPPAPLICAHKGFILLNFTEEFADPVDVGPAATRWPNVNFVVYHSAVTTAGGDRGPYNPGAPIQLGADRLIKTVEDHGLKGQNVYAELGSAWFLLTLASTNEKMHFIGKLLKHLGEDNVVWGSECLWFNSPQPQIEAFRALTITQEFQDQFGYPALTDQVKRKIFGLNAAKIYNIDVEATRCKVAADELTKLRHQMDGEFGARRWALQPACNGPRSRREFLQLQRWKKFVNQPG